MLFLLADGMSHSKLANLTPISCQSHYFGHLKVERSAVQSIAGAFEHAYRKFMACVCHRLQCKNAGIYKS